MTTRLFMVEEGTFHKSVESGKWMFINTLLQRVLSIGTFFVLARLLTPEDFGIMAIVLLVPPLLDLAFTIDFDSALIQRTHENPRSYFHTIWTINIIRSFIVFLSIYFVGDFIATFFHIEQAAMAIKLGGLFILIQGFANVAQLLFFKEMDFKKILFRDIVSRLAYSATAIFLAWHFRSYWALFWSQIILYSAATIATYFLCSFRPKFTFSFTRLRHLFSYSKWLYGQSMLGEFAATLENAIIGRLMGPIDVGFYTRAKALASTPTSPLISLINKVGFSAYARIQDDTEKIKDGYLKMLNILFFVGIPFTVVVLLEAPRLILIALGPSWIGLTKLFQILVAASIFQIITSTSGSLFNALGLPKHALKINIIHTTILSALLIVLTILYGTIGTAMSILIASLLISIIILIKFHQLIRIQIRDIIFPFLIPLISSLLTFAIGSIITKITLGDFAYIVFLGFLGAMYLLLIALAGIKLRKGPYQTLKVVVEELNILYLARLLP